MAYGFYYVLDFQFRAFAASLGIIGIAIAFASQQVIQNVIGGLLIAAGRPVQLDDWVEIGGSGISNVKDITMMRTVLRDRNGKIFYIPNSIVISSTIINYTRSGFVEIPVLLTIPYGSDVEKARNILMEIANKNPRILPNVPVKEMNIISRIIELPSIKMLFMEKPDLRMFEPKVLVSDISVPGITLSIRLWIREINKRDEIVSEYFSEALKKFKEEKIELK